MIEGAFVLLLGLLFISGLFMLPAWAVIAAQAHRENDRDYAWVAHALALNSVGTILFFGARLVFGFSTGEWMLADGPFAVTLIIAACFFEASKVLLMLVRARHGKRRVWWAFAALSLLWALFALLWTIY